MRAHKGIKHPARPVGRLRTLFAKLGYASLGEVPAITWWHRFVPLVKHLLEDGLRPWGFLRPGSTEAPS
jgi:hypothetical protein